MQRGETVTLKEYVDALLDERDKRHDQRDHFNELQLATARGELREKLGYLNELRGNVATKDQMEAITVRISDMKSTLDGLGGGNRAAWKFWAAIVAAVATAGVLFGIAGFVLAHTGVKI